MRFLFSRAAPSACALTALLALAGTAMANPGFDPVFINTTPSGSNTAFNYTLNFGDDGGSERLDPGDFVTIYDIPGFVSATAPPLFTVSTQNLGITAAGTAPADDATLVNVTYRYAGAPIFVDTLFLGASIVSSFSGLGLDNFTSETTNTANNTTTGHIGFVTVPAVPEPTTFAALGAGGLLLLRRRR